MGLRGIIRIIKHKQTLNDAAKAYQRKDLISAKRLYLKVLKKNPDNFHANLWLGSLYSEMGKYTAAIEYLNNAIRLKPSDFRPYLNLGLLQANLKREEIAIKIFENGISNCRMGKLRKAELYFNIARLKIDLKDFGAAIDYANSALSIVPNYEKAERIKMYAFNELYE